MKRFAAISFFAGCILQSAFATFTVTNEVDATFNSSSYDTEPYKLWGNYFASYFYCMYPQFTNHLYSWSQSGSGWEGDYENNEEKWCLPLWASFAVPGNNFILANDNGGYVSNDVVHWGTNIFAAPAEFWNGSAKTNEGVATAAITHFALGAILGDTPGGSSAAVDLNAGSMALDSLYGTPAVDLWNLLGTNGWIADIVGARKLGFYSGGHPFPAGHLCMALKSLGALGVETNIGSLTFNWPAATASTNRCTASGINLAGGTLSATVHFDRMPGAWDVPDGTITNDARDAFTVMPELGDAFQWTLQVTNLPLGNYRVAIDGSNVVTLSSAQLAAGWNMFTNYNGPLWAQRKAVLTAKRDQEGVDHVGLLQHSAGSQGTLGVGDLVNFQSNANEQYITNGKRGATYVAAMSTFVANLQLYDVAVHDAAQQTNHTFSITLLAPRLAPFHR